MQIRALKMNRRWPYSLAVFLLILSAGHSVLVASNSDDDTVLYDPDIVGVSTTKAKTAPQKELKTNTKTPFKITFDPKADIKGLQPDSARPPQTPWHTPASADFLATSLSNDPAEFEPKK